ncbi:Cyclic di-GMP phosphodiesterase response regulator RpfG [Anaerolineales bacterium]|nr:Cyclic di-GMP phosphodiesterase response regulator RpfG [Anaerolineales bacterium]
MAPKTKFDNIQLAAHVTKAMSNLYRLEYARISPGLKILQCSPNFSSIIDSGLQTNVVGESLPVVLPEFFGLEDVFHDIMRGKLPSHQLENVQRDSADGSIQYLTFNVLPFESGQAEDGLLLIVEDVTRFGQIEHALLQNRNELRLAQSTLAQVNADLDRRVEQRTAELEKANKFIVKQLVYMQALRANDLVILGATDLRIALKAITREVRTQLNVDSALILSFDQHALALETLAKSGIDLKTLPGRVRLGDGILGRTALERRIMAFPDFDRNKPEDYLFKAEDRVQAFYSLPLVSKGKIVGVLAIANQSPLNPDQGWLDFLESLAGQAAMAIDSIKSFEELQHSNLELSLAYSTTIEGWSHALDLRDRETKGHTQRVTDMTLKLARMAGLSQTDLGHIKHGALLHDIGKMGIPDNILLKEHDLTGEEWEIMRRHPIYAYEMLSPIEYLRSALDIPYCHHEKWDGTGYPRGLSGEKIPLAARLFAVVDVWDALRSDRPYRQGWSEDKVVEYIQSQSGTHFDPYAVDLFSRLLHDIIRDPDSES